MQGSKVFGLDPEQKERPLYSCCTLHKNKSADLCLGVGFELKFLVQATGSCHAQDRHVCNRRKERWAL